MDFIVELPNEDAEPVMGMATGPSTDPSTRRDDTSARVWVTHARPSAALLGDEVYSHLRMLSFALSRSEDPAGDAAADESAMEPRWLVAPLPRAHQMPQGGAPDWNALGLEMRSDRSDPLPHSAAATVAPPTVQPRDGILPSEVLALGVAADAEGDGRAGAAQPSSHVFPAKGPRVLFERLASCARLARPAATFVPRATRDGNALEVEVRIEADGSVLVLEVHSGALYRFPSPHETRRSDRCAGRRAISSTTLRTLRARKSRPRRRACSRLPPRPR